MNSRIKIKIDGKELELEKETTILEAARRAEIYIPALCHHPDLFPFTVSSSSSSIYRGARRFQGPEGRHYEGCRLCIVEEEKSRELLLSCSTIAKDGMSILTATRMVQEKRRENLVPILAHHPHACLTCSQAEGCSREPCSTNVPLLERCCDKFGNCEVQKVSRFIGIREDTPRYIHTGLHPIEDEPLVRRDYNLCINCLRCVRACNDLRGVGALGFTIKDGRAVVGSISATLVDSGCRFCLACIEVCPTGALLDRGIKGKPQSEEIVPCRSRCPVDINVPLYLNLIAKKRFREAASVVREKVPFPFALGYICFHPCEDVCKRKELNAPVSICSLKRFAMEHGDFRAEESIRKLAPTGRRVAIIGSGPAGLTAAYYLNIKGHSVQVFEQNEKPGGMLRYGIPSFRFPKDILDAEIEEIERAGVEIRTGIRIGADTTVDDLLKNGFDVVFLSTGASLSKKLEMEGIDLDEVFWGVDFLQEFNSGKEVKLGERVVVIGGGNVAIDVAMASLRCGAKDVRLYCLEKRDEMPSYEWEIAFAEEEGVKINASWGPERIIAQNGRVKGIELIKCTSVFDENKNFSPMFDGNVRRSIEADTIIFAIGQNPDVGFAGSLSKEIFNEQGFLNVNSETLQTTMDKLFAGGEIVTGPSSVVEAIAQGKRAASSIDKYLGGDGNIDERFLKIEKPSDLLGRDEDFAAMERVEMQCLSPKQRLDVASGVIETGYSEEEALREASRCLRCDLRLRMSGVPLPPEKWIFFTEENVADVPETDGVIQLLDEGKNILLISGSSNMKKALMERLASSDRARFFIYEEDPMYTKRESELLQQFLQKHNRLPEYNDELSDLF
ncbi:MAG: FAD-dependent oxidoreductase [Acidobacteriota bacterium]